LKFKPKMVFLFIGPPSDYLDMGKKWAFGMIQFRKPFLIPSPDGYQIRFPDKSSVAEKLLKFFIPEKFINFTYFVLTPYLIKDFCKKNGLQMPFGMEAFRKKQPAYIASNIKRTLFVLDWFKKLALENGFQLVVGSVPENSEIEKTYFENSLKPYGQKTEDYDLLRAEKQLKDFCVERGISYLNVKTEFLSQKNPLDLYFKTDPHLVPVGNSFLADIMYRFIEKNFP
jgi:hypothetical protein